MEIVIIMFYIIIVFCLIGFITYMTQCQIQKLVEEIATLRYEIQELRKKIINKKFGGNQR